MGILLVRHSDAVGASDDIDDTARWLTEAGRARAQQVARALSERGLRFDVFVSSPRVRAVQTAELFAAAVGFTGAIAVLPSLSFAEPAQRAADDLSALVGNVAAFGHMPTLAETSRLLGGPSSGFAPSEAVWIERGRAVFSLRPEPRR